MRSGMIRGCCLHTFIIFLLLLILLLMVRVRRDSNPSEIYAYLLVIRHLIRNKSSWADEGDKTGCCTHTSGFYFYLLNIGVGLSGRFNRIWGVVGRRVNFYANIISMNYDTKRLMPFLSAVYEFLVRKQFTNWILNDGGSNSPLSAYCA